MKKLLYILFVFIFVLIPTRLFAFNIISSTDQGFDTKIVDESVAVYTNPEKIYITQVTTESSTLSKDAPLWVKTLYYYSVTRLNFAQLPFNYLVDESGNIYEGRTGGVSANPEMVEADPAIVIGYLSNNPEITSGAAVSLKNLVEDLSYRWGITSLGTVKLNILQKDSQLSKVSAETVSNDFSSSVSEALEEWKGYDTEHLEYVSEIVSVVYEPEVVVGNKLHVALTLKNKDDFAWFTDKYPIYVSTSDGSESKFAVNGVWDSFSKPAHVQDAVVQPEQTTVIEFDLQAQAQPGENAVNFVLQKFDGKPFGNSAFDVSFNIVKGDNTLVMVSSPQYGFVNIRECQWYSCKIIDSVLDGTVFVLIKEESGWMEIQYNQDTVGWVYSKYMKRI